MHWWQTVSAAYSLPLEIDADSFPGKHDNAVTRGMRSGGSVPASSLSVMNFRRLPAWLESSFRFARSQGLTVPETRYLSGEFFSLRTGEWCPADWWLDYFDARSIDLLLPLERLGDALEDLLWQAFGLRVPDGLALARLNQVGADIELVCDWTGHNWADVYRRNPLWADLEAGVYGAADVSRGDGTAAFVAPELTREAKGRRLVPDSPSERPLNADRSVADLLSAGAFTKALSVAMQRLSDLGESAEAHADVANIEMLLGFLPRAERSWRRALQLEERASARLGLGICLFQGGETLQAVEHFRQGLKLDGDSLPLLTAASIASLLVGDFAGASDFAEKALVIDPRDPDAMLCAARSRQALGQVEDSRELIGALERLGHKPDEVALLRAELRCAEDDHAAAMAETSDLCERYPDSLTALAAFRKSFAGFRSVSTSHVYDEIALSLEQPPALETVIHRRSTSLERRVDVIIPVHNAPDATKRAIDAVLQNSGTSIGRLILIDDASGKETSELLSRVSQTKSFLELVRCDERQGFTRALRLGIERSDAAAFVALNSDTIVTPEWLERLAGALGAADDIAMAGPLSNNAAWQNYGHVFDESGRFVSAEIPGPEERAVIAAEIQSLGRMQVTETSMVHGFCAIVDRAKHDAVGGLDAEAFPEGYGEFQDLSYRFRAAGHKLVVALDTVVFHEKGASLSQAARAALSLSGRRKLYDRYSAINYLFVEAACAHHREMAALRRGLARRLSRSGATL